MGRSTRHMAPLADTTISQASRSFSRATADSRLGLPLSSSPSISTSRLTGIRPLASTSSLRPELGLTADPVVPGPTSIKSVLAHCRIARWRRLEIQGIRRLHIVVAMVENGGRISGARRHCAKTSGRPPVGTTSTVVEAGSGEPVRDPACRGDDPIATGGIGAGARNSAERLDPPTSAFESGLETGLDFVVDHLPPSTLSI